MKFLKKVKETFLALLPLVVIVLFVHCFFYKFDNAVLIKFLISIIIASFGEALLLNGIDSTIMPMGELMAQAVNKSSKFVIFIFFAVVFGMFATIAEPDVSVFSGQVVDVGVGISKNVLVFCIGAGVGVAIAFGLIRIVKNVDVKYVYLFIFATIFLLCTQVSNEYIALAFDAGGATTGIITAPFLLAISSGVSNKINQNDNREVFGMVGIASLGPVISSLLVFIFLNDKAGVSEVVLTESVSIFISVLKQTTLAIVPLTIVFYIYELIFIKLPVGKKFSLMFGLLATFVGLYLFLFSMDFGITAMGTAIGTFIETLSLPMVVLVCVIIGFVIAFSEPSVIVLSRQVQDVTKGNISSFVVIISIAISMALAILVTILKIVYSINFFYIIMVGYFIALVLMFFVPSLFTGLAFDSGGVASGPMTSAFLLPIMIEFASTRASSISGFGIIGIVALSPIIVLQILGFIYKIGLNKQSFKDKKRAIKVSYTFDMYSNIEMLENEYKLKYRKRKNEKESN